MTTPSDDDREVARIVALITADPAVRAAADQLRAARRDNLPMDPAQEQALGVLIDVAIRRGADEMGIPPDQLPAVLEALARSYEAESE